MNRIAFAAVLCWGSLLAADPPKLSAKRATSSPPKTLAPALRDLMVRDGIAVTDAADSICTIWLRADIDMKDNRPTIGSVIGCIQLHRAWSDYKSQEAPAGVYTMRYVLQPESKDHEGTAPHRDFVVLLPATEDVKPEILPLKTIVQRSGKATGGTHPVVMLVDTGPRPAAALEVKSRGKRTVVAIRAQADLGMGFTIRGSAVD